MDTILSFFTATEYLIERCVQTQEWKNVENAFLNLPTEIEHSICYKWRSLWMVWIHELRCSMQDLVCMIVGVHEYVLLLRRRWSDMKIVAKIVEHASTFHRSPTTKFCFMEFGIQYLFKDSKFDTRYLRKHPKWCHTTWKMWISNFINMVAFRFEN